jgi:hypothetical protein
VGHPACVSSDGGIGVKALGPRDSEGGREEEGDGRGRRITATPFPPGPHMVKTERGEKGNGGGWR